MSDLVPLLSSRQRWSVAYTEDVTLICSTSHNLPSNQKITYSWKKDGEVINGETSKQLKVEGSSNKKTTESYECIIDSTDSQLKGSILYYYYYYIMQI